MRFCPECAALIRTGINPVALAASSDEWREDPLGAVSPDPDNQPDCFMHSGQTKEKNCGTDW